VIAKPEDSRRADPEEAARHLSRELDAIERAHGQLDRHVEPPPAPIHPLGTLRPASLEMLEPRSAALTGEDGHRGWRLLLWRLAQPWRRLRAR